MSTYKTNKYSADCDRCFQPFIYRGQEYFSTAKELNTAIRKTDWVLTPGPEQYLRVTCYGCRELAKDKKRIPELKLRRINVKITEEMVIKIRKNIDQLELSLV